MKPNTPATEPTTEQEFHATSLNAPVPREHQKQHAELIKQGLDRLFGQLSTYLSNEECTRIRAAFVFADGAHLGQYRQSGEPYITHPIAVATLCATWKLDSQSIKAALMHDVMEDSGVDKITLANEFGAPVANLVDGLSKLDKLSFDSKEAQQAESFRKMLLAMADDVRVILIKLADRLHNLSTMQTMRADKRRRIAQETLEIYAPIAHRLGLDDIYRQLQDLCFEQIHPWRAKILKEALKGNRQLKRELFGKTLTSIRDAFELAKIPVEVTGREKNLSSIYYKMQSKKLSLSNVLDVYGFRVIVDTRSNCYVCLGILHAMFNPVPGKFKDYIAIAKKNGYQSLHTVVLNHVGKPMEFQIRTHEMERNAESGIATHWLYKESDVSFSDVQKQSHINLQSLLHIQQKSNDSIEFLEHIKVDLSPDAVYVFTPKSKILSLPRHATVLDFAYSVHTDIGNHTTGALINGVEVPISTELQNGDRIHIITNPEVFPQPTWLKWAKTSKARLELRSYFKTQRMVESATLGEQLLNHAIEALGLPYPEDIKDGWEKLIADAGCKTRDELHTEIGLGIRHANITAQRWLLLTQQHNNFAHNAVLQASEHALVKPEAERLVIRGDEVNTLVLSKCCRPIRGDAIIGFLQRKQGLVIHTADCLVARKQRTADNLRWIDLEWDKKAELSTTFPASVSIIAANEKGLLAKIAGEISESGANIADVVLETVLDDVRINIILDVNDRIHLAQVFKSVRSLGQVKKIARRFTSPK
jgi:GTP pyrophosphokinase